MFIFVFYIYYLEFHMCKTNNRFSLKIPKHVSFDQMFYKLKLCICEYIAFSDVLIDNIKGMLTILVQILLQMREHLLQVYGHDLKNRFTFIADWGYDTKQNPNVHNS